LVYKKRQDNIRRSDYGYAARREILWIWIIISIFLNLILFAHYDFCILRRLRFYFFHPFFLAMNINVLLFLWFLLLSWFTHFFGLSFQFIAK
jgi:hypothetical protein